MGVGTMDGSEETGKYIAVYLPLCAKVIASEKDTSANKVKCSIEHAKVQTLECRGDLQVRK